jgi:hypothetical protein
MHLIKENIEYDIKIRKDLIDDLEKIDRTFFNVRNFYQNNVNDLNRMKIKIWNELSDSKKITDEDRKTYEETCDKHEEADLELMSIKDMQALLREKKAMIQGQLNIYLSLQ